MPYMRWVRIDRQPYLFAQFQAERSQRRLTMLGASARRRPDHHSDRLRDSEPAQQDAVTRVEETARTE